MSTSLFDKEKKRKCDCPAFPRTIVLLPFLDRFSSHYILKYNLCEIALLLIIISPIISNYQTEKPKAKQSKPQ